MRRRRALHLAGSLLATSLAGCTALGDALTGPHHYERDAPVDGGPAGRGRRWVTTPVGADTRPPRAARQPTPG